MTRLGGPYRHESGNCWQCGSLDQRLASDRPDCAGSRLRLFENGKPLLSPHAPHDLIRSWGNGFYSHWCGSLYFSSSDSTDPNANGKVYEYRILDEENDKNSVIDPDMMFVICRHIQMAEKSGVPLTPLSRILDFGSGSGKSVMALRRCKLDAWGFDVHNYLELSDRDDERYFRFSKAKTSVTSDFTLEANFTIPYEDNSFDYIFSNTVLEHVQDFDVVMRELSRILRPGGLSIHHYPPRYVFREPHTNVPLGGVLNFRLYLYICILAGVRNEYCAGQTPRQITNSFHQYVRTGLNYLPPRKMLSAARKYFKSAEFAPELWSYRSNPLQKYRWYRMYCNHTKWSVLRLKN